MADCQTDVPLTSNVKELLLTPPICRSLSICGIHRRTASNLELQV